MRQRFLARDSTGGKWRLDEEPDSGTLSYAEGRWTISQGGMTLAIELAEMEQILNVLQLLVANAMPECRPSEIDPEEFASWPHHSVDMLQACQNPSCCAHGHHVAETRAVDELGVHKP